MLDVISATTSACYYLEAYEWHGAMGCVAICRLEKYNIFCKLTIPAIVCVVFELRDIHGLNRKYGKRRNWFECYVFILRLSNASTASKLTRKGGHFC